MLKNCYLCGKDTHNPKYCSSSCAAKVNNALLPKRQISVKKCKYCDEVVHKHRSRLCALHFLQDQPEYLQTLTLADYCERECIKKLHPSSKFAHIRNHGRTQHHDLLQNPCYSCGYSKHVELCHIKALSSFPLTATIAEVNHINNVVQLCPNCHWEFDKGLFSLVRKP